MSYETNQNNIKDPKSTELVEDYLNLIRCSQPYCTCGKCISHRYSHNPPHFSYEKNIKSSYKNEFDWKRTEEKYHFGKGRKHFIQNIGLDNCFKEHLQSSLGSVMKNDYSKSLKLRQDYLLNNYAAEKPKAIQNIIDGDNNAKLTINVQKNPNKIDNSQTTQTVNNKQRENNYTKINNYNSNNSKKLLNPPNRNSNKTKINYFNKNANFEKNNRIQNNNSVKTIEATSLHLNNETNNKALDNDQTQIESSRKRLNPPFIGRSSYELMYPNWQTTKIVKEKETVNLLQSVPFNGRSSYQDNFHSHEKRYYLERTAPIIKSDNLESSGKLIDETTTKVSYRPIDYKEFVKMNNREVQVSRRPSSLVSAPYSKDSFLSSYERAFMYNNLKARGTQLDLSIGNNSSVIC